MSVYFYGCVTMDGYLAGKNHDLSWLSQTGSAEETDYEAFYKQMDVTVMGKRTYEEIERSCVENVYPSTRNYVFTHASSLSRPDFIPVAGSAADFVASLNPRENIWVVGGNTILSPLLERDLVDFIILQIAPVLLGAGIPLFTQKEKLRRFRLMKVCQYGPFAELVYEREKEVLEEGI